MTRVKDILNKKGRDVTSVAPDVTVLEAARMMNAGRIGALVVTEGAQVIGMFTERDVMNRVVATEQSPSKTLVRDVMTAPVTACSLETTLTECDAIITEKRIRHLPVVVDGQLAGIISVGDIVAQDVAIKAQTIDHLHDYLHRPA